MSEVEQIALPTQAAEATRALEVYLVNGGLLPFDEEIVLSLTGVSGDAIRTLLALDVLRLVVVGKQVHLSLASNDEARGSLPTELTPAPVDEHVAQSAPRSEMDEFQLDVALDVAHEKQLLYRIVIVLEVIAALLLIRWMAGWFITTGGL